MTFSTPKRNASEWEGREGWGGSFTWAGWPHPKCLAKTLIQALFFEFLFSPHAPTRVTEIPSLVESQLEKTPLYRETDHHFFIPWFPPVEKPSPTLPTLPLSIMIYSLETVYYINKMSNKRVLEVIKSLNRCKNTTREGYGRVMGGLKRWDITTFHFDLFYTTL